MKKVLVISYHFHPEISPRAFRAFELAKELGKKYEVHVLTPVAASESTGLYKRITIPKGLGSTTPPDLGNAQSYTIRESAAKNFIRKVLHFVLPGGLSTLFAISIVRKRKKLDSKYDAIISIGLPIGSHFGAFALKKFFNVTTNLILDYGDPFTRNPKSHWSPLNYIMEKALLRASSHAVVPVANALPAFEGLVDSKKMHIIPQGLNIDEIKIANYSKNKVTTVAYAGLFYEGIRDPEAFLEKILSLNQSFRFLLLTDLEAGENRKLLEKYKSFDIHNRIEIIQSMPRAECILFLSSCDFLVNFRNQSATQNPSKLIDYTLARRPILDVNTGSSDIETFERFLNEDYAGALSPLDLNEYDIKSVANKFAALIDIQNK